MSIPSAMYATIGAKLHAINQETGAVLWEADIPTGRSQLVVHQGRIYVASEFKTLSIFQADTGALLRTSPLSGMGQAATLLLDNEKVFVTCGGVLHAFTLEGAPLWINEFKGRGNGSMAIATAEKDRQADEY